MARDAALSAGLPPRSHSADTVAMACISSLSAASHCAMLVGSGACGAAIAGGVEFMSDAPIRSGMISPSQTQIPSKTLDNLYDIRFVVQAVPDCSPAAAEGPPRPDTVGAPGAGAPGAAIDAGGPGTADRGEKGIIHRGAHGRVGRETLQGLRDFKVIS